MTSQTELSIGQLQIRELKTTLDCTRMQPIMTQVWGPEFVVPSHLSFKIAQYGGVVLGAFVGETMAGFNLAFPMYWNYLSGLYSHMMAVLPEYQSSRVGMRLKLAQGIAARTKGYRMVTWTYDPLESPNARLNMGLLGAICNEYMPNYYGTLNDNRNRGVETDRFQVQWWVETPRVSMLLEQFGRGVEVQDLMAAGLHETEVSHDAPSLNQVNTREDGLLVSNEPQLGLRDKEVLLRVPRNFQVIKQKDRELACQWRLQTRAAFTNYFARGWTVTGFLPGTDYNTYVLQK